jgi:hypothetical protein
MKRSSNQFTKEFDIKTFEFSTTDKSICTAPVTCIYTIENVVFRPNLISPSAYVLQGDISVSSTQRGRNYFICISFHQKSSCKLYLRSIRHNVRLSNTGIHFEKNVILASSSWLKYSLTFPIISYWSTPSVNRTLLLLRSYSIHIIRSNSLLWLSLGTVDNCFVAYLNNSRKIDYSIQLIPNYTWFVTPKE